jgi:hypothetical protein
VAKNLVAPHLLKIYRFEKHQHGAFIGIILAMPPARGSRRARKWLLQPLLLLPSKACAR